MTWNYRIVRRFYHEFLGYGLHEVYYDNDGNPSSMTVDPIISVDEEEGPAGIISSLERALDDAKNRPVFDEPEGWVVLKGKGRPST